MLAIKCALANRRRVDFMDREDGVSLAALPKNLAYTPLMAGHEFNHAARAHLRPSPS